MSDEYAAFPEEELLRLAAWHEGYAKLCEGTFTIGLHEDRAETCRNAVKSFDALRDRCHEAELLNNQLSDVRALSRVRNAALLEACGVLAACYKDGEREIGVAFAHLGDLFDAGDGAYVAAFDLIARELVK